MRLIPALCTTCAFLSLLGSANQARAQTGGWNEARALELIERARYRRTLPIADSSLKNYQSRAEGMIYFYLDRRETEERTLVKTDQIALEVFWAAPNQTKQRIVGLRDESRLPNRMYYHLDHLTIVQNEFGNVIRLGDGDEVRDAAHPAAPGSDSIYDFRLADSLELVLPGAPAPVKAYEIEVRPRNSNRPAFVGSVFVDRATADIVRMTFTFTPASYVDRRLDYIAISLDNSLWDGRYWLPFEQHLEIRRQLPELDFVAGAVIQARFRVRDYQFNQTLPPTTFMGAPVVAVPSQQRENFPFEKGLYDDIKEAGLAPPAGLRAVRAQAAELVEQPTLSGLPRFRFSLREASSAFRYNRAEGAFVGGGVSYRSDTDLRALLSVGFAMGPEHASIGLGVRTPAVKSWQFTADAFFNEPRDLGIRTGAPGTLNSLAAITTGEDYLDLFYATGARAELHRRTESSMRFTLGIDAERHRSGSLTVSKPPLGGGAFRPVLGIDEGWYTGAHVGYEKTLVESAGWVTGHHARVDGGILDGHGLVRANGEITVAWQPVDQDAELRFGLAGGLATTFSRARPPDPDRAPRQHLFLLGGRQTLPGYSYRSFAGDVFALANVEYGHDVVWPWVRLRLLSSAGWTDWLHSSASSPLDWNTTITRGVRASAGAGVGLFFDIIRIDAARGFRDGKWQFLLSVHPDLWSVL